MERGDKKREGGRLHVEGGMREGEEDEARRGEED